MKRWSQIRRSLGTRRIILTGVLLLAAVLLARFSWQVPVIGDGERLLFDLRSVLLAQQATQDDRVLMVVYDDQTLIKARKRSPLDRGLLAQALRNLDNMGAKAIGIDILFDQPQDEDAALQAQLRAMRTPTLIAYARTDSNELDIRYEQQAFLDQFLASVEGARVEPASIRLDNNYGVTRLWPTDVPGLPPLLGRAMVQAAGDGPRALPGYVGSIRYRRPAELDRPVFARLQIDLFADPALAPILAEQVRGRYVLIGGDIVDVDRVETPFTAFNDDTVASGASDLLPPGIEVHATMIAQMLDGARRAPPSPLMLWGQALLVVLAAALTAMLEMRSWRFIPLLLGQLALFAAVPFAIHVQGVESHGFPALGPALGWGLAFVAVLSAARASGSEARRFAQGALGKYLPREMAQEIIEHPELLALHGEKKDIFVLFSDLEGFTQMSHALEPEVVAQLLNRYLDMLSQVVLDHGGVIDKFVGDAVVAFWGAPIARADDGERAARAGYALWQAGEEFRRSIDPSLPPVGRTRVGLHWGEAVVGNFGGQSRIQYTALGDSMNTASRLEAANKVLGTSVIASREFAVRSGLDWWRPLGRVVLRGRAKPVDIYEPAPDFPPHDKSLLEQAVEMLNSDPQAAIVKLRELVGRNVEDKALGNLLSRAENLNEEKAYVLG